MKILHIVSSLELGGIENLVFSMMRADVKNVSILAIHGSKEKTLANWPALVPYSNNLIFADKKAGFSFKVAQLIKQTCQEHSISILHSHHIGPLIYASLTCQLMNSLHHVHTQHDIWHLKNKKQWWIEYLILSIKKKIHLVAVSKDIAQDLKRLYPRKKISLIYNGIDTTRFIPGDKQAARSSLNIPSQSIIIANSGRLEEVKGQTYLIQALKNLPEPYFLAIAGKGSLLNELEKEAHALGLSERISFLGQIDKVELLYQAADLFCLPSIEEGLPLAILEAQACNLPVVCSNVGSCADGVYPKSSRLIPPKNPTAIAKACEELVHSSIPPRSFIEERFSLSSLIEQYQLIYTMLCNNASSRYYRT